MEYVTFGEDGSLTGSYSQELHPEHEGAYLEVSEEERANWLCYRLNESRDGLVKLPPDDAGHGLPRLADSIPMLNLQLVLIEDGKLDEAEEAIAALTGSDGQRARAYWSRAMTARLDNDLVQSLWPLLYASQDDFLDAWSRASAMNP